MWLIANPNVENQSDFTNEELRTSVYRFAELEKEKQLVMLKNFKHQEVAENWEVYSMNLNDPIRLSGQKNRYFWNLGNPDGKRKPSPLIRRQSFASALDYILTITDTIPEVGSISDRNNYQWSDLFCGFVKNVLIQYAIPEITQKELEMLEDVNAFYEAVANMHKLETGAFLKLMGFDEELYSFGNVTTTFISTLHSVTAIEYSIKTKRKFEQALKKQAEFPEALKQKFNPALEQTLKDSEDTE